MVNAQQRHRKRYQQNHQTSLNIHNQNLAGNLLAAQAAKYFAKIKRPGHWSRPLPHICSPILSAACFAVVAICPKLLPILLTILPDVFTNLQQHLLGLTHSLGLVPSGAPLKRNVSPSPTCMTT